MIVNCKRLKKLYAIAKNKKVGETTQCPSCETEFVKTNYQQAFCKTKGGTTCKDFYWNNVILSKRNNVTRISPANKEWMDTQREKRIKRIDDNDTDWNFDEMYGNFSNEDN